MRSNQTEAVNNIYALEIAGPTCQLAPIELVALKLA